MVDCDDQLIDNEYEQRLRDRAHAAYLAWSERHHTAWAQDKYHAYLETLWGMFYLPDGVRIRLDQAEPSAASLVEIPERDFSKGVRGKYAKRLTAGEDRQG